MSWQENVYIYDERHERFHYSSVRVCLSGVVVPSLVYAAVLTHSLKLNVMSQYVYRLGMDNILDVFVRPHKVHWQIMATKQTTEQRTCCLFSPEEFFSLTFTLNLSLRTTAEQSHHSLLKTLVKRRKPNIFMDVFQHMFRLLVERMTWETWCGVAEHKHSTFHSPAGLPCLFSQPCNKRWFWPCQPEKTGSLMRLREGKKREAEGI